VATDVVIPKLGMTMKEGTIVEWAVADGARVDRDQVVFVLSTDKLDTDVTAEASGTLHHRAAIRETYPVGTVVAVILADGEVVRDGHGDGGSGRVVSSPYARHLARELDVELGDLTGTGPGGRVIAADVTRERAHAPAASAIAATPVARQLADQLGVDLSRVAGTGPAGRITKSDVRGATPLPSRAPADSIPLRGMRKVIAERMHASLEEMAQLTLGMEVDMTDAVTLRKQLVREWERDGVNVSFTDLVGRAVVKALGEHPALNASIDGEVIRFHPTVHLGVAVAVDDGLLVPVVRDAGGRTLRALAEETSRLASACRNGTIGFDDLDGATFTVSSLGSSGVDFFTPIVNPPNVAILGVGRLHDGVGWDGDRPVRRTMMTLSLTIDHRAIDGVPGAAFLSTVRDLLESPYRLLV
jgi:pyruvate/2-oxoglutarate dehydrogenase complex dihydrolipoamide acyltransferase (E2) component